MKEYTVKRYSFNELEGEARERAIKAMSIRLNEWIDEREITDYLTGEIEEALGGSPEDIELRYSLGYSQGDGVAIYGQITREEAPNLTWPAKAEYVELTRNSWATHNSHYNTFNVTAFDGDEEELESAGVLEVQLRDLCKESARAGYKYIEDQSSISTAISYLEENYEDEFTLDGTYSPITITDTSEVA
jgi:hypothetical protein